MDVMARFRTVAAAGLALAATSAPVALAQGSLFTAVPVELSNFVLVSAPIGQGHRCRGRCESEAGSGHGSKACHHDMEELSGS